jgi:hypothetical protein
MEATSSSETPVCNETTRRHIPEAGMLHSHRRENLKSYTENYYVWKSPEVVFILSHMNPIRTLTPFFIRLF